MQVQFQGPRLSTYAHWHQFGTGSQYHEFLYFLEFHFQICLLWPLAMLLFLQLLLVEGLGLQSEQASLVVPE